VGVETKSVILIGANPSQLTWDNLTTYAKHLVYGEVDTDNLSKAELEELAKEYFKKEKNEILSDWFGFVCIGSYWTGVIEYQGVEVHGLSIKNNYEPLVKEFNNYFTIEPDIHSGVLEF